MYEFKTKNHKNKKFLQSHFIELTFLVILITSNFIIGDYLRESTSKALWGDDAGHIALANNFKKHNSFDYEMIQSFGFKSVDYITERFSIPMTFGEKGPIYYIILGSLFKLLSSTPENWYNHASVLSNIFTSIFLVLFFFFVRKWFNLKIAIASSLLILTTPYFGYLSARALPLPLLYIFVTSSLFFLERRKEHYLLFGFFSGLALLTHPFAVFLPLAYGIFLLLNREFKGFSIFFLVYQIVLLPWYIRGFLEFGNFGHGLFVPFSKSISELLYVFYKPEFRDTSSLAFENPGNLEIIGPNLIQFGPVQFFEKLYTNIDQQYGVEFYLIFVLLFSGLAFFRIDKLRHHVKKLIIFFFGITASYIFIKYIDIPIIDTFFIFLLPIALGIFIYKKYGTKLLHKVPRQYVVLAFVAFITILASFAWNLQLGSPLPPGLRMIFLGSLFLVTPLAVLGLERLIHVLFSKKIFAMKVIPTIILAAVLFPIVIDMVSELPDVYAISSSFHEKPQDISLSNWMKENIPKNAVVATNNPGGSYLRTGLASIPIPIQVGDPSIKENLEKLDKIIDHFNVSYIAYYTTPTSYFDHYMYNLHGVITDNYYIKKLDVGDSAIHVSKIVDLLDADASQPLLYAAKGKKLVQMGNVREATRIFDEVKNYEPQTLQIGESLCSSLTKIELYDLALGKCMYVQHIDPRNIVAFLNIIFIYQYTNEQETALMMFEGYYQRLISEPNNPQAIKLWKYMISNYSELDDEFRKYADSIFIHAQQFEEKSNYQSALNFYDIVQSVDKFSNDASYKEILILTKLERFEEALKEYDFFIDLLENKIQQLQKSGKVKEALEEEKSIINVMHGKATLLKNLGKYNKAELTYLYIIGVSKFDAHAWTERAILLEKLDRLPEAVAAYEFLIKLEEDHTETLKKIADLKDRIENE